MHMSELTFSHAAAQGILLFSPFSSLYVFFFFFFFTRNGDNLHEMSNPVFWENKKTISICHPLKILTRVLSVKKGQNYRT